MKVKWIIISVFLVYSFFSEIPAMSANLRVQENNIISSGITYVVGEGNDFASQVLHDPWDMSEFFDISQWFNHGGSQNYLLDYKTENGVFSALTGGNLSYFIPLWGGYEPGLKTGKIGTIYPISTSKYGCYYMAMHSNTPKLDHFLITWGNEVMPPSIKGTLDMHSVHGGFWNLHKVNLYTWPNYVDTAWSGQNQWQFLQINPSLNQDIRFSIDWIRLTDCQPVNVTLQDIPDGNYAIWLGSGVPERQILAVEGFAPDSNGNYIFDVQGIAPGNYKIYITYQTEDPANGMGKIAWTNHLNVLPSPVVTFSNPSMTSGMDYATEFSTPWDFADWSDAPEIRCAKNIELKNSILKLTTPPPSESPECVGSNVMDPMIFLSSDGSPPLNTYRFVSFRHMIEGSWSVPEEGMVVRWVWTVNRSGAVCTNYSKEFALDVGWQTYSADMYEGWNGEPAAVWPSTCPKVSWKNETGIIQELRFEPNENITNDSFDQQVDWIRLTKVDQVIQGHSYRIRGSLNVPEESLVSIHYFYTNDLDNPTQFQAEKAVIPPSLPLPYSNLIYMPMVSRLFQQMDNSILESVNFKWDTTKVALGEYYICALASDGYNQSLSCSNAPIEVISS